MARKGLGLQGKILSLVGLVLAGMLASGLYTGFELRSVARAVGQQLELLAGQGERIEAQGRAIEEQGRLLDQQGAANARERAAIEAQLAALEEQELVHELTQEFGALRFWITELAVSFLNESELRAEAARARIGELTRAAEAGGRSCTELAALVVAFHARMLAAVEAYTDENRVLGNSLASEGRQHGERIDAFLGEWADSTSAGVEAARLQVVEASHEIESCADQARQAAARIEAASREVEQSSEEVGAQGRAMLAITSRVLFLSAVLLVATLAAAALFSHVRVRAIIAPLREAVRVLGAVAEGDLTPRLRSRASDEIGLLSAALDKTLDSLEDAFAAIRDTAKDLGLSSGELAASSKRLSTASADVSRRGEDLRHGSDQVNEHVRGVAVATQEMGASITEIARTATQAAGSGNQAAEVGRNALESVRRLEERGKEIDSIVSLITGISAQTSLLALNATIEAARAGEMGRGFAVVAGEVKELARATAKASEDIGARVATMREDSERAASHLQKIGDAVHEVSQAQATVASAVEEQTSVTSDIGRSVTDVSAQTGHMIENIAAVATAAEATRIESAGLERSAVSLAETAEKLCALTARFRFEDRGGARRASAA